MSRILTFFVIFSALFGYKAHAQLAGGTYTINSAVATGGTNYISFGAAVTAMASGITGPVIFNVVAGSGPYTEQVTIGNITGTSATNTIKFNGNGATVQYNSTTTYSGVLMLNGAKFVKIDSLIFKTTNVTYGYGANIYNVSTSDTITRCTFDCTSVTSTSSINSMGLRIATTATGTSTTASGANNLYFANNKILGGTAAGGPYYGLYVYGTSTGCVFANNLISNFYYYGMGINYTGANNIFRDNEITRATKTSVTYGYGAYITSGAAGLRFERNKVHTLGGTTGTTATVYCYPFYFSSLAGTAANPAYIINNIAYDMNLVTYYAIYASSCANTNIYHNTVNADIPVSSSSYAYGFYLYPSGTMEFKNNVLNVTGGGTGYKYGIYAYNGWTGPALARNVININSTQPGSQIPFSFVYVDYPNLASFQTAYPAQEVGSVSVNPQFAAPLTGNLAPTNTAMFAKGVNLQTIVPTDIVGQARLAAPAAGAFEFQANGSNNAGMVALTEPLGRYCPGSVPVKVSIYNGGTNNITSVKVNWSLNGVVQTPVTYTTTTLYPLTSTTGSPIATLTLGNAILAANVPVGLKVWTSLPNNTADAINANDTLIDTIKALILTVDAYRDTVCLNKGAVISLTPGSGFNTGALSWESSTNGGASFPPVLGSDVTTLLTPNLTANTWFRVKMTSGANTCYSDTAKIYTTNPQLLSHTPDTMRCGPGQVSMHAQSSANSQIKWFDNLTSNAPIATGSTFTTPFLAANTSYWLSAGIPDAQPEPANVIVNGTQTTSSSAYMPFYGYSTSALVQYIITAQDMMAQGYSAGNITSLGLETTTLAAPTLGTVNISMKPITASLSTTVFETAMQPVYSSSNYVLQPNATNTFNFQTPFYWDGFSNICVSICKSGGSSAGANTFVARYNTALYRTAYNSSSTVNLCNTTSAATTMYYMPHMILTMTSACETPKVKIDVTVNPKPAVDLGPDINVCVDAGTAQVLDAGLQPNTPQFLWDNGSTLQIRSVAESGTYSVKVTNQYTCSNSDTINVILRPNPVVHLGNDTTVCNGVTLNLNPGNGGIEYFWNTGQTSQDINVNNAGTYSVFVTNNQGCTKVDTIVITMLGDLPSIQGVNVTNNGQHTFHFTAVNPQNVIGYDWDFGDGSTHSYQASPIHTYPDAGNYIVVLHLSSSCGFFSDSSSAHIVSINQLNIDKNEMTVYPNPTRETATILNHGQLKMEDVAVYNALGQVVYKAKADSKDKHTLQLSGFASGVYTIQVYTDKGTVARKLEIIK